VSIHEGVIKSNYCYLAFPISWDADTLSVYLCHFDLADVKAHGEEQDPESANTVVVAGWETLLEADMRRIADQFLR
jgi:hypothetical protein